MNTRLIQLACAWSALLLAAVPAVLAQRSPGPLGPGDPVPMDNCASTCGNYQNSNWTVHDQWNEWHSCCLPNKIKSCMRTHRIYQETVEPYRQRNCCLGPFSCGSPGANCAAYDWVCPGG
jgi:hypothetical protein